MSKKKRRFEQLEAAAATNAGEKKVYINPLQERVEQRLEGLGKSVEGRGKTILYAIGALVVILILAMVITSWNRRSTGAAQFALGKAMETSEAQVSEAGTPAGSTQKVFKTEKERAEAAIADFQSVADTFGGAVGEKAKYFIAVNRLTLDRAAGTSELQSIAGGSSETAKLAKFALAQVMFDDGNFAEAEKLYRELAGMDDPILAKETVNYKLGQTLEKLDRKQEAADLYFNIAKAGSELKDAEGKPVRMSESAQEAKKRLEELAPDRAKEIVEPAPASPFGM